MYVASYTTDPTVTDGDAVAHVDVLRCQIKGVLATRLRVLQV